MTSAMVILNNSLNISSTHNTGHIASATPPTERCNADSLTDAYGLIVQVILAALAFGCLVLKRCLEVNPRPWLIWFFDTSKQAVGAGVIHFLNVFLAPLFAGDPCTWYVVSFLLDSTLGLVIIFIGVKMVSLGAKWTENPTLKFGEYGNPPGCRAWLHQCLAFIIITILEKIVITIVLLSPFWIHVRKVILSPITNPKVEVTLVMLIIPFLVNALMFWVVDNFTMKKPPRGGPSSSKADPLLANEPEDTERLLMDIEGLEIFGSPPKTLQYDKLKHRHPSELSSD